MSESIYLVSWNINGIRSAARKGALAWIDREPPQILALQEIRADEEQFPDNLFDHDYKELFVSASSRKGYSGVAVYSDLECDYRSTCPEVDRLGEGRVNEMRFGNLAFFNVYFPNGKRNGERLEYKLDFYDRFFETIERRRRDGMSVIFCGDLNTAHREIDLARPEENRGVSGFLPKEREWMDRLIESGYIDAFRYVHPAMEGRYSWWSQRTGARRRNVGWRIDYFFVSGDLERYIEDADILDGIYGSDHAPVTLRLGVF